MIMRSGDKFTFKKIKYEFIGVDPETGLIVIRNLKNDEYSRKTARWFEVWRDDIVIIEPSTPLLEFLKNEIPYRLFEILEYREETTPPHIVEKIIKWIYDRYDLIEGDRLESEIIRLYEEECAKL